MHHRAATIFLILTGLASYATVGQVLNNTIENRSKLRLDAEPLFSNTDYATVEWNCINKLLTSKCLKYHNDQWFQFDIETSGKYYLNISSQKCRQSQGIQAIIIEGNPCEIKSYKIIKCIAQLPQQDVFIELDSMKSNVDYLLNIDGFLGDFCSFDIQLSSKPSGFSFDLKSSNAAELSADIVDDHIILKWTTNELLVHDIDSFEIYRSAKGKSNVILRGKVPVEINAAGVARIEYFFKDSLVKEDINTYRIVGAFKTGVKQILGEHTFFLEKITPEKFYNIQLVLDDKNGTLMQLLLMDKQRDEVLRESTFLFNKKKDAIQQINVSNYLNSGINHFIVRVVNLKTFQKKDYEFIWNEATNKME